MGCSSSVRCSCALCADKHPPFLKETLNLSSSLLYFKEYLMSTATVLLEESAVLALVLVDGPFYSSFAAVRRIDNLFYNDITVILSTMSE